MTAALGFLETTGYTPAMAALDAMDKTAGVRVLQAELNDFLGVCLKVVGPLAAVKIAVEQGRSIAERMQGRPVVEVIANPEPHSLPAIESPAEYNQLIQQEVVSFPAQEPTVSDEPSNALGFIETQGFTAVFSAIDSACKSANVEVVGKEKLGGGYVTVVVRGDVAAVETAIETGRSQVAGLGTLIAAHVIPRPSGAVLGLLPKLQ